MKLATRIFRRSDWTLNSPFGVSRIINGVRDVHNGTDYGTYGQKWPQYALEDGIVTFAGKDNYGAIYCWVHYPRIGMEVQYFHLDKMFVKQGQKVAEDTIIGNTGTTGRSTGIHLHLALRKCGATARLDPDKYDYVPESSKTEKPAEINPAKSIAVLAEEVLQGEWGSGDARKKKLAAAGYDYAAVQQRVNEMLGGHAKYAVKPGDSWRRIARIALGSESRAEDLAKFNGKTTASIIHPGDVLKIPKK